MFVERPEPDIVAFYRSRYVEDDRLCRSPHGQLEFVRTQELLRRVLPPAPATVLDVGGGTGVHARWLARDGYAVHVVDLVPDHVAMAAGIDGVTAEVGDARSLAQPDGSVDAALVLGPLYHLPDADDRILALSEARRVLRPGGVLAAAAISRHSALLDAGANGALCGDAVRLVREMTRTGRNVPALGFTTAYFHTANELRAEAEAVGLRGIEVYGVEGPLWPALDARGLDAMDAYFDSALTCAREVERDPLVMAASAHLLALAVR